VRITNMDLEKSAITTVSGKQFFLANPSAENMAMVDVVYSLSRICRYGGHLAPRHVDSIYSVLQHSVYVYHILKKYRPDMPKAFLWGLLHDATEAWYGDVVSPLKVMFPAYSRLEDRAAIEVRKAFNIPYNDEISDAVHWADQVCWRIECMEVSANPFALLVGQPIPDFAMSDIDPDFYLWPPSTARQNFRAALEEIRSNTQE
jgi:hypothetical protein